MKKLFFSLLITFGAVSYSPCVFAGGTLRTGGKTLVEQGRTNDLTSWLLNVCGATSATSDASINGTPTNNVGDVYFVGINHYWKGSTSGSFSSYDQINKGVDKIEKVSDDSKLTTSSGTFYTYEAKNANKFFFIVRRSTKKTDSWNLAFKWYDEWSYVENTDGGYEVLEPSYDALRDGAPFFSPHNCDTSLETNHYITLNDKEDDSEAAMKGYNFTSFLYIPTGAEGKDDFTKEGTGEYDYVYNSIVYVYKSSSYPRWASTSVSSASSNWYVKNADGTYSSFRGKSSNDFYRYTTSPSSGYEYQAVEVYVRTEIQAYKNAPYVFFYTDELKGARSEKHGIATQFDCPYDAVLNWSTAFDKYKRDLPNTKYDGIKEHYILERSYDRINWETVEDVADVEGNDVTDATKKTFTDTNLKDFDETTAKIGYTVYYRLTSVVQKADGTEMARRMAPEIVTIIIPGTSPFSITLEEGNTSTYIPGTMQSGNYVDGHNEFVNALIAAETPEHEEVVLAPGAKLDLVRTDAENPEGKVLTTFEVTDTSMTLASLATKIGDNGRYEDAFTTAAGDAIDAQYQLRLTIGNSQVFSNLVDIVGDKVSNASVAMHRSGTPDAATCAEVEMFGNEVTFKPANTGIGTGYYIYCNGENVMTLVDNGNLSFSGSDGKTYKENAQGELTIMHNGESSPIAVGEESASDNAEFSYAVAHFDNNTGNTYGSEAKSSMFMGEKEELVVALAETDKTNTRLGYDYNNAYVRPLLSWSHTKLSDDVKSPIRYEIFRKVEKAEFEKAEVATETATNDGNDLVNMTNGPLGEFVKVAEVAADVKSYNDQFYYKRKPQTTGNWVNQLAAEELRPTSYYIKAIYSDDAVVAQNIREKNSAVISLNLAEGSVFTAVNEVEAEGVSVVAENGIITVTGVAGNIAVYNANGQAVANANGDGSVTEIDATSLEGGVYVVKADNMKPTKILIK